MCPEYGEFTVSERFHCNIISVMCKVGIISFHRVIDLLNMLDLTRIGINPMGCVSIVNSVLVSLFGMQGVTFDPLQ